VKIEVGAERCVNVLLDVIATRVSYVVQEAVVHEGYFSQIPTNLRRRHSYSLCESRRI
ncbi:hypothetical protein BGW80DRAFT_1291012, partial [Lactifluus volemus]